MSNLFYLTEGGKTRINCVPSSHPPRYVSNSVVHSFTRMHILVTNDYIGFHCYSCRWYAGGKRVKPKERTLGEC